MTGGREISHHHAEAVIERHRQADAVGVGVVEQPSDQIAVVADIAVTECRPFGKTRCARGVLDIDRIVGRQRARDLIDLGQFDGGRLGEHGLPSRRVEQQYLTQSRTARARLREHRRVLRILEMVGGQHDAHPRLVQRVLEFGLPVGGVDVDQDRADLRCGVLHDRPFGSVRRPQPDAVAHPHADPQQTGRRRAHIAAELGVGPLPAVGGIDEREVGAESLGGSREGDPDRLREQFGDVLTLGIRQHSRHGTPMVASASTPRTRCLSRYPSPQRMVWQITVAVYDGGEPTTPRFTPK